MLEVLRGRDISDVAAVVTRWFGGTLLGTGGLARAYADAVRAALDTASTVARVLVHEHEVVLDHADAGRVAAELRARRVSVLDASYGADVVLRLGVPPEDDDRLLTAIAELTAGSGRTRLVGERWLDSLEP
jgi:putative IMPACT (imprinted ancient) family translation regulator